jgi:hypothetical protein
VNEARQNAHGIGAATEPEQIDVISILAGADQEFVGRKHVVIETIAGEQTENGDGVLPELPPRVRPRERADAGIVEHELMRLRLAGVPQAPIQLENVGNVLADLVAGAVAADDDVFHGGWPSNTESARNAHPVKDRLLPKLHHQSHAPRRLGTVRWEPKRHPRIIEKTR